MHSALKIAGLVAMLPSVLACNAYTGGVPTPTSTKSHSAVIEVAAGATYE